ncbi:MAG TPA: hypothetical protein VLE48_00395 [Terriglobales bacterium]|nr:hypothetical protein [Terriglobales bacterium]
MILGAPPRRLLRLFPLVVVTLLGLIRFAQVLGLTRVGLWTGDYVIWGDNIWEGLSPWLLAGRYLVMVLGILAVVVALFVVLGGLVGEQLRNARPLAGYGNNLAGSLAGIAAFTLLSVWSLPPVVWAAVGCLLLVPFLRPRSLLWLTAGLALVFFLPVPEPRTYWSPYYRISLQPLPTPQGWNGPSGYSLTVNHDFHQRILDLSPEFMTRFPDAEPHRRGLFTYDFPYRLAPNPGEVLVVGAGTGNDVAAALRHGATHVDAVEIDPQILALGRRHHPEHPYEDPRVTTYVDDARAFFKKAPRRYDTIVFGYLDSHTLFSGFSSLRLDNYVYTVESLEEARHLLREGGSLFLSFAGGRSFVSGRLYQALTLAFGAAPAAYDTGYDQGVIFVQGAARQVHPPAGVEDVGAGLAQEPASLVPRDRWPFLYLLRPRIPGSILVVLVPFLCASYLLLRNTVSLPLRVHRQYLHLLLLGAGFLLLETKAITEVSLLFGSTWVVNAVVIAAFLGMALLANAVVMFRPVPRMPAYVVLFLLLGAGLVVPYGWLSGAALPWKVVGSGVLAGLPVFCSGLIFSRSFRDVTEPQTGLGVNLFGAVVGGTLENLVMVGGTPVLGILAVALYALSAAALLAEK